MARNLLSTKDPDSKPRAKEYLLSDGEDLFLRIRPSGAKSWVYVYSLRGDRRKYTIGNYPTISLAKSRELADAARLLVAAGIHPIDEDNRKVAAAKAREVEERAGERPKTVNDLFDAWEKKHLISHHKDKGAFVRGMFERHVSQVIGDLPLEQLRPRHIIAVLDKAHASGVGRTCGSILGHLRQMCQFALPREWLPGDPTAGLKKGAWGGESKERERHLSEDEVKELDKALRESSLPARWRFAVLLILATGTRVGETLKAKPKHFWLDRGVWLIPKANQKKTKAPPRDHLVDLSPFALRHAKLLIELVGHDGEWLFPARGGKEPVDEKALTKLVKDRQRDKPLKGRTTAMRDLCLSGGPWTPHDLRRTMSTLMGELNIDSDVIDKCQNHREPNKIKRTYQRQQMKQAMKAAWLALGQRLDELTEDI
jgi:integrase